MAKPEARLASFDLCLQSTKDLVRDLFEQESADLDTVSDAPLCDPPTGSEGMQKHCEAIVLADHVRQIAIAVQELIRREDAVAKIEAALAGHDMALTEREQACAERERAFDVKRCSASEDSVEAAHSVQSAPSILPSDLPSSSAPQAPGGGG